MLNKLSIINYKLSIFQKGQSLVEVVVSISVVSLILVSLVSAITFSMSNTQYAKNKALATKYAQEAIEFIRSERDKDWDGFYARAGSTYCLTTPSWPIVSGNCSPTDYIANNTQLVRQAVLTADTNKVSINVTVSWVQGSQTSSINVGTLLTKWE